MSGIDDVHKCFECGGYKPGRYMERHGFGSEWICESCVPLDPTEEYERAERGGQKARA